MTLPSVEGGFGSMNIIRDPPKSIHTHYKPKVSDTSKITEWVDASGDRVCEGILKYSRGVNPMVSVNYSNNGTNGGQVRYMGSGTQTGRTNNRTNLGNGQSFLPYRVMRDGEFRPPIVPPQELLPLSRMPRMVNSLGTNPGSNLSRQEVKSLECGTDLRAVRKELMKVCAGPRRKFNINLPTLNPEYDVQEYIVNGKPSIPVVANISDVNYKLTVNSKPERGINENRTYMSIPTKAYKNLQATPIMSQLGNQPIKIKNRVNGNFTTNISSNCKGNLNMNSSEVKLRPTRPTTSASTNARYNIDLNGIINNRNVKLAPRTKRGGFLNSGTMY